MISDTADVHPDAKLGTGTRVWDLVQVREGAIVGANCILGRGAYIDHGVVVGDNCKIQNGALVYAPARLANGVFIGPGAILTNDRTPRAVNRDGTLKAAADWNPMGVTVGEGAAIGAGAVLLPGVTIGAWALVGAGAVVTRDVPAHALVAGSPCRQLGWVGFGAATLVDEGATLVDPTTGDRFRVVDNQLEAQ